MKRTLYIASGVSVPITTLTYGHSMYRTRAANDRSRREIPPRRTWYMRRSRHMLLPNFIRILTLRSLQALLV